MGVAQDPSPPPPGGLDEPRPYTELEEHALSLAGELRERVQRERDTVARLGGDEFAVVLEDMTQPAAARRVAQAILQAMDEPFDFEGVSADVDVSIGVALYNGGPAQDRELMRLADVLLYRAKGAGRGRYEIGPPELAGELSAQ
jgi:diguanylate cyclase (GGDEF)-like protein